MLELPFFEERHRELSRRLNAWVAERIEPQAAAADEGDPLEAGRAFIRAFASCGLLQLLVPDAAWDRPGSTRLVSDLRSLCLAREAIAGSSALADAVFAVQGLGSYPVALGGLHEIRERYLPRVVRGESVAAFALTEPGAGSDVRSIRTTARRRGDAYVIDGTKTLISNAGLADFYVVFARHDGETAGAGQRMPISAFLIDAGTPGLRVSRAIRLMAPHPIGELVLEGCRVPAAHRLGDEGAGYRLALRTLDFFRASVGAAACGMAGRALREAQTHVVGRRQFGSALADFQATRFALADMRVELDAARLLVYRAAWLQDRDGGRRFTQEASMAKLFATEAAQRIVDRAVQLHGGAGVTRGFVVERLYREVRALRIYEGTSEIQRLVIADHMLRDGDDAAADR